MSKTRLILLVALSLVASAELGLHRHQTDLRNSHHVKTHQNKLAPYLSIKNKQKRHLNTDHDLEPGSKLNIQLPARVSPWQRFS